MSDLTLLISQSGEVNLVNGSCPEIQTRMHLDQVLPLLRQHRFGYSTHQVVPHTPSKIPLGTPPDQAKLITNRLIEQSQQILADSPTTLTDPADDHLLDPLGYQKEPAIEVTFSRTSLYLDWFIVLSRNLYCTWEARSEEGLVTFDTPILLIDWLNRHHRLDHLADIYNLPNRFMDGDFYLATVAIDIGEPDDYYPLS